MTRRLCQTVSETVWLLAVLILPIYFNPFSARVFDADKAVLLRSLSLVSAFAWSLERLVGRRGRAGGTAADGAVRAPHPVVVCALAVLATSLLATVLSITPVRSLAGSYFRQQGVLTTTAYVVLFGSMVAGLRTRSQIERLLATVVVSAASTAAYASLQHFGYDIVQWPALPWDGPRVAASLGHPIFLGAYLGMAVFVVCGLVARQLLADRPLRRRLLGASGYALVGAMLLAAEAFTQSRGPMLGLFVGLVCFIVLLASVRRSRRALLIGMGLVLTPAALLLVASASLTSPNGVSGGTWLGHYRRMFDANEGSGQSRTLIWQGMARLAWSQSPLVFPDGHRDRWSAWRPLVGYGPDSQRVAFERFVPQGLARLESRAESRWCCLVDRAHNETLDAQVATGALGTAAGLALSASALWTGLASLGLLKGRRDSVRLAALTAGLTAASSLGFFAWHRLAFVPLALTAGLIGGVLCFAAAHAWRGTSGPGRSPSPGTPLTWRQATLIGLTSAIASHLVEISIGIATVTSRVHFWVFAATLVALARGHVSEPLPDACGSGIGWTNAAGLQARWRRTLSMAGLLAAVLGTIGFESSIRQPTWPAVALFTATGLVGGWLLLRQDESQREQGGCRQAVAGTAIALAVGGLFWAVSIIFAHRITDVMPGDPAAVRAAAGAITAVHHAYLVGLLALGFMIGTGLFTRPLPNGDGALPGQWRSRVGRGIGGVCIAGLLLGAMLLNVRGTDADMVYNLGRQLPANRATLAVEAYEFAFAMAPQESAYATAAAETSRARVPAAERPHHLVRAVSLLDAARRSNPVDADLTVGLARLFRDRAETASGPARRALAERADAYYRATTVLSPHQPVFWDEWASLALEEFGDTVTAQRRLERALSLDQGLAETLALRARLDQLGAWRKGARR